MIDKTYPTKKSHKPYQRFKGRVAWRKRQRERLETILER